MIDAAQRATYFGTLWPAACAVLRFDRKDEAKRRMVTRECMRLVGGPAVDSLTLLGQDEITALFWYLKHLAAPADLELAARWVDIQKDYKAFNRGHQADWHEAKLYGRGRRNKLQRDRFGGKKSANGEPFEKFDPQEIRKRHLTYATRHRKKEMKNVTPAAAAPGERASAAMPSPGVYSEEDRPF